MNMLDELQQAWQSQCVKPLDISPDQLLKTARFVHMRARFERWAYFVLDMVGVLLLLIPGTWMLWRIRDIQKDWPWLIYVACIAWVVGFILFNQWRGRRRAARYEEPLVAHVEWAIKDIEYRMWKDRHALWWYILPLALGCMIPPTISLGLEFHRTHNWGFLFTLLFTLGFFAAFFAAVHWIISRVHRMRPVVEARRRELEALRALRETLLSAPNETVSSPMFGLNAKS